MAIIECPECKKRVSDENGYCPHCYYFFPNFAEVKMRRETAARGPEIERKAEPPSTFAFRPEKQQKQGSDKKNLRNGLVFLSVFLSVAALFFALYLPTHTAKPEYGASRTAAAYSPAPMRTLAPPPTPSAFPRPSSAPAYSKNLTMDECISLLDVTFAATMTTGRYKIYQYQNLLCIDVTQDGIWAGSFGAATSKELLADWNSIVDNYKKVCSDAQKLLNLSGHSDTSVTLSIVNDLSPDRSLLVILSGMVVYDYVNGIDLLG